MPAKSKQQQKFMGIVRAIQKGDEPASKFSKDAQDAADDMKKKDVEKFASTKHKGLPKKVEQYLRQQIRKSVEEIIEEDWFKRLSSNDQKKYLKDHPNSKKAKQVKANKSKVKNTLLKGLSGLSVYSYGSMINQALDQIGDYPDLKKKIDTYGNNVPSSKGKSEAQYQKEIDKYNAEGEKIKKDIAKTLKKEVKEDYVETCGYTQSVDGKKLKTPGATGEEDRHLKEASTLTLRGKNGKLVDVPRKYASIISGIDRGMSKFNPRGVMFGHRKYHKLKPNDEYSGSIILKNPLSKKDISDDMKQLKRISSSIRFKFEKVTFNPDRNEPFIEFRIKPKQFNESTIQEQTVTPINKIKGIKNLVKKDLVSYRGTGAGGNFEISIRNKKVPGYPPSFALLQKDEKKYRDIRGKQFKIKPVAKYFIKGSDLNQLKKFGNVGFLATNRRESVDEAMNPSAVKKMRDEFEKTGQLPPHLKKFALDLKILKKKHKVKNIVVPGLEWMSDMKEQSVNENRDFEKLYNLFTKKDYFNLKNSIKTMLRNWETALKKGDKGAQKYKKQDIIKAVTIQNKANAKRVYDELVTAIKKKDIRRLKSRLRYNQPYSIAIFNQTTGKKLPKNTRDIQSFLDNEFMKESVNEARLDPQQLLKQLGGNRFIMMVGAKNLVVDKSKNELHMKIGRNSKGVSHVRIRLSSMDLYDMEFLQVRAGKIKIKSKEKGVYADQLGKMFKKNTGMNVRL